MPLQRSPTRPGIIYFLDDRPSIPAWTRLCPRGHGQPSISVVYLLCAEGLVLNAAGGFVRGCPSQTGLKPPP